MGLRNRYLFKDEKCFFVSTTCKDWIPLIQITDAYSIILHSLNFVRTKYSSEILAYVIMPNHIHLIVYFKKDNRLSDFMRDFKKYTSIKMLEVIKTNNMINLLQKLSSKKEGRHYQVWQDRFDDLYIKSKDLLEQKLEYIHLNPLQEKWKLASYPEDYPYSSAAFYETSYTSILKTTHYLEYF